MFEEVEEGLSVDCVGDKELDDLFEAGFVLASAGDELHLAVFEDVSVDLVFSFSLFVVAEFVQVVFIRLIAIREINTSPDLHIIRQQIKAHIQILLRKLLLVDTDLRSLELKLIIRIIRILRIRHEGLHAEPGLALRIINLQLFYVRLSRFLQEQTKRPFLILHVYPSVMELILLKMDHLRLPV